MHQVDYGEFRALLNELSEVLSPGKPLPDDVMVQRYVKALKDQPIEAIKRAADRCIRYGKFFPKPFELRPRESKPKVEEPEQQRSARQFAQTTNQRVWAELLKAAPVPTAWKLLDAYLARIDAQYERSDLAYQEKREFARTAGEKLLADSPPDVLTTSYHAWHVALELWPTKARDATPLRSDQLGLA